MHAYFVYLMTNSGRTVLYTGVTNNLQRRVWEHQQGMIPGFTKRYRANRLVYHETYSYVPDAIAREKQIKGWTRAKKDALIATLNPAWNDLAVELFGAGEEPRCASLRSE